MTDALLKLYGIGPVQAAKLRKQMLKDGEISAEKTYTEAELRRILKRSKRWNALSTLTRADISQRPDKKVPREIIAQIEKALAGAKTYVGGSYSRGRAFSRDVDIVLIGSYANMLAKIKNPKVQFGEPIASGESKITVFVTVVTAAKRWTVKADVFLTNTQELLYCKIFATGSGRFNLLMRGQAKRLGYKLNQRGLYKNEVRVPIKNEKHLFETLGMKYRTPAERDI